MKILVVNDDGIQAPGIRELAKLAKQFGEVTVAAPKSQCSGMSHRITVDNGMEIARVEFPVARVPNIRRLKPPWPSHSTLAEASQGRR